MTLSNYKRTIVHMTTIHYTKILSAAALSIALVAGSITAASATDTQTVCHDGETIEVPHSKMWEHFDESGPPQPGHEGDTRGACKTTPPPTTTTTSPNPGPQPCDGKGEVEEDDPCFDCETMGNKVCGPVTLIPPAVATPPAPAEPVDAAPTFMG